jgi:hypothetical protein
MKGAGQREKREAGFAHWVLDPFYHLEADLVGDVDQTAPLQGQSVYHSLSPAGSELLVDSIFHG